MADKRTVDQAINVYEEILTQWEYGFRHKADEVLKARGVASMIAEALTGREVSDLLQGVDLAEHDMDYWVAMFLGTKLRDGKPFTGLSNPEGWVDSLKNV